MLPITLGERGTFRERWGSKVKSRNIPTVKGKKGELEKWLLLGEANQDGSPIARVTRIMKA